MTSPTATPNQVFSPQALDVLFREARSHNLWTAQPVSEDDLHAVHELMKFGPTSANCWPLRVVYVRSEEAKAALAQCAMEGNRKKIVTSPVTAVLAHDRDFHERMNVLFPHNPGMAKMFANDEELARKTAFRNGTLQGAYFMLAARCVGLDCAPMSGFDNDAVDALYFEGTNVRSNFLCGLGHGDPAGVMPRLPRPAFDDVASFV